MKKLTFVIVMACIMLFSIACLENTDGDLSSEIPKIDENITVRQSLQENWSWDELNINNLDYHVFTTWEDGRPSDYKYALLTSKKPDKNGRMQVASIYFKDTYESDSNYDYLFNCPGVFVCADPEGLRSGDSFIFGPYPIVKDGYRDICVGYSENGWFMVNDTETACDDNGIIIYLAEHGYEIQFGNFRPKE